MAQNLDRAILSSSRGRLWFCNGPFALAESVAGRRSRLLRVCYTTSAGFQKLYKPGTIYLHRGALRGTPGSACPQPEPNTTELPSCALPSQRELHNDGGGGGGVARRARAARAPKAKSCATSCGTPSATTSATTPRPMFSTLSKDTSMPYFLYKMSICHVECSEALASVPYGIVLVRVRVRMFLE